MVSGTGGTLCYSVSFHDEEVIAPSEMGIVLDGVTLGQHASLKLVSSRQINEEYPTRGIHSTARCNCTEYVYDVKDAQADFQLQMRVFDDGVAFRYVFDGESPVRVNSELTTFRVPANTPVWFFERTDSDIVSSLNPAPDSKLFADTGWIKPGRSVWSWWSKCDDYLTMPLEKHFVDAARELGYEYTLIDEEWEKWTDKWTNLQEICGYAHKNGVNVLVWKHADELNIPEGNYGVMASFLDSIKTAGADGIKIDFMNSEAKSLIDFDVKALQFCAERRLLVDFHGCQKPSGESRTYPNELTREGIRGLELNRMDRPLSPNHNVALVFTRCILGNADYTPIGFTRPGPTTFAHQLATAFAFTSPLTVVGEHVDVLLKDERVAPMLPLIKALPTAWDETVVLPQSRVGSLALLARRSGDDWYVVALNGDKAQTVSVSTSPFLESGEWNAYAVYDNSSDPAKVEVIEADFSGQQTVSLPLAAGGGCVAKLTKK